MITLIVDQKCRHVLEAVDQYQWDTNPNLLKERPKHNNGKSYVRRFKIWTVYVSKHLRVLSKISPTKK